MKIYRINPKIDFVIWSITVKSDHLNYLRIASNVASGRIISSS